MRLLLKSLLLLFTLTAVCAADDDGWKEFIGPERLAFLESVDTVPASFYVSPDGSDAWSGRLAAPNTEKTDGPFRHADDDQTLVAVFLVNGNHIGCL
ncbi:MAG: hypothetical protein IKT12_07415, partial [Thermoguttaceae bacterium]|nr:hypothetical protein [Thermoguttaceae bacterium]